MEKVSAMTLIIFLLTSFAISASGRPGIPFHPCSTLYISYSSFPIISPHQNPNFLTIFPQFPTTNPNFHHISLPRPGFLLSSFHDSSSSSSSSSSSGSVVTSLRDRTKDIISVVAALLFGVGCGFLTAATLYLLWSLISNRMCSHRNSYCYYEEEEEEDEDDEEYGGYESPKKAGYLKVPASAADSDVDPTPAMTAVVEGR